MTISSSIMDQMQSSSWIRKMFETGQALKQRYGAENVFDLSLGSPMLEPPEEFTTALREIVNSPEPGMHRYMPNPGYNSTRAAFARHISAQEQVEVAGEDITVTVGAAGAINVALASILDPGDEVIIFAPYFVEYIFYARNHQGVVKVAETTEDFDIDIDGLDLLIGPRTKCILLNTPNNPTGRVYSQERMTQLANLLDRSQRRYGNDIYLMADTPYGSITYDGVKNPLFFKEHPNTLIAHSFSKELGIAGERLGFLAINPAAPHRESLQGAFAFTNRTLGFVNAPALMQRVVERSLHAKVDVAAYQQRRDALCDGLQSAGYDFVMPRGAFYLFPRSPVADDVRFAREMAKENVLVVPGSGFGRKGYVRVAYCVNQQTIQGAIPKFVAVHQRLTAS